MTTRIAKKRLADRRVASLAIDPAGSLARRATGAGANIRVVAALVALGTNRRPVGCVTLAGRDDRWRIRVRQ